MHVFSGTGPGSQTRDGCSVSLYRVMPYMDELADIESHLNRHPAVLELGCGTGRLCGRLQEIGLHVAGVDESAEMLAHLPIGVEGIKASIETLDLGRRWPAVLLPSHLINHPDEVIRKQFVEAAKRHITPFGTFYIKRHSPRLLSTVKKGPLGVSKGIALHVEHVSRDGDLVTMTIRYNAGDQAWTQSFSTCVLQTHDIEQLLSSCGFQGFQWLGAEALWVAATSGDA